MTKLLFDTDIRDWRLYQRIERRYRHGWGVALRVGPLVLLRTVKRRGGRE
jgi:hypothetical protein